MEIYRWSVGSKEGCESSLSEALKEADWVAFMGDIILVEVGYEAADGQLEVEDILVFDKKVERLVSR